MVECLVKLLWRLDRPRFFFGRLIYRLILKLLPWQLSRHPRIRAVAVVGSCADESHEPWMSDLDFVIITDAEAPMGHIRRSFGLLYPGLTRKNLWQHAFVFTESEWERVAPFYLTHPLRPFKWFREEVDPGGGDLLSWKPLVKVEIDYFKRELQSRVIPSSRYDLHRHARDLGKIELWEATLQDMRTKDASRVEEFSQRNTASRKKWERYFQGR